ncbi:MAG: hypothetical protein CL624_01135 [Arcobacter sp.]|nr:hypothetical protein [Arcobacter sp.]
MNLLKKLKCLKVMFLLLLIGIIIYYSNSNDVFLQELWILIFLLCPIMHIIMHKGHHNNKKGDNDE